MVARLGPPTATPARNELRAALAAALTLVNGRAGEDFQALVGGWSDGSWGHFERVLVMHGLNPWLWENVGQAQLAARVPARTVDLVAAQHEANILRIDALHEDLATVLRGAAEADIALMPLKGALISTSDPRTRYMRPMADLDLLVAPTQRERMASVLARLGYTREAENSPRPTHDVFMNPGGGRIVSFGEHVDNPRRIELHTDVMRHLWGWIDRDTLTPALWLGARLGTILGAPAWIPRLGALAAHLAIHASSDLLVRRGRLVQWLDLAKLEPAEVSAPDLPDPVLAYPSLALTARALPELATPDLVASLRPQMPRAVVRWVDNVSIDDRAGVMFDARGRSSAAWQERWSRWAPYRWRLGVAYGDLSLPLALVKHSTMVSRRWGQSLRRGAN